MSRINITYPLGETHGLCLDEIDGYVMVDGDGYDDNDIEVFFLDYNTKTDVNAPEAMRLDVINWLRREHVAKLEEIAQDYRNGRNDYFREVR